MVVRAAVSNMNGKERKRAAFLMPPTAADEDELAPTISAVD